ncbi:MAG: flagellar FlbD family protein [Lachnospiraceae bacterium]|jgi:flagellar protein FlbD|nr:flagellar FlbD family protein [Lachnospiraceae bacterium]MCI9099581.1 flagellar FlbD family protein [Lachnospiraceae bacterium]MCI9357161.1 flagellar FlbD family protein [Lachnospiraceae bacterium]
MIQLTKINGELIVINGDRIECMETIPESKISMDTGRYYLVQESVEEIIQKTIEYHARIKEFERTIRRH